MLSLDSSTKKLQIVCAGAKNTNDMDFEVTWQDVAFGGSIGGGQNAADGSTVGRSNGVTAVDLVPAFPSGVGALSRRVENVCIQNADLAAVDVTVQLVDSASVTRKVIRVTLQTLENLCYEDGAGWYCLDVNGNIKTNQPASSAAASTADSKATSAGLAASTADSKAVSDSVNESTNRSVADSKDTSQSTLISALTSRVSSKGG